MSVPPNRSVGKKLRITFVIVYVAYLSTGTFLHTYTRLNTHDHLQGIYVPKSEAWYPTGVSSTAMQYVNGPTIPSEVGNTQSNTNWVWQWDEVAIFHRYICIVDEKCSAIAVVERESTEE